MSSILEKFVKFVNENDLSECGVRLLIEENNTLEIIFQCEF